MTTYRRARTWIAGAVVLLAVSACAASASVSDAPARYAISPEGRCAEWSRQDVHQLLKRAENVISITPLERKPLAVRPSPLKVARKGETIGTRILVRPGPGLTAERLQAAVNCDRAFAVEAPAERDSTCPFELASAKVTVASVGDAFAIDIVSDDPEIAHESFVLANRLGL